MQKFHFSFKIRWTLPSMESINPSKTHGEKPWLNSQPQSTLIGGAKTCKTTPYEFLQNYGLNLDSPTKIFPSKKKSLKPFAQEIPVTSPKTNRRDNGKTKTNHLKMYIYICISYQKLWFSIAILVFGGDVCCFAVSLVSLVPKIHLVHRHDHDPARGIESIRVWYILVI